MTHFPCRAAKIFFFSALSALMLAAGAAADEDLAIGVGQTTGASLRMRSEPTTDASVVVLLRKNCTMEILDDTLEDWYKVSYDGNIGYVSADYFKELETESFQAYARVNGQGVYVREEPNDDSNVLNVIDDKAIVTCNAFADGWYHVKCQYGTEGYIRSDFLDLTNLSTSSASAASSLGEKVVAKALRYKGTRYVYGGATPGRGFDCSGFTMYVYKQFGISLPHTASGQWSSSQGTRVYSKSALQPGDLVLFNDPRRNKGLSCSHVGIYIGDGKFVHASSGSRCVTVSSLSSDYYRTYYKGGVHFG